MALKHDGQFVMPLRKTPIVLGRIDMLAGFLSQTEFFIDNADCRLRIEFNFRMLGQALFGGHRLAGLPLIRHFFQHAGHGGVQQTVTRRPKA